MEIIYLEDIQHEKMTLLTKDPSGESNVFLHNNIIYKILKRDMINNWENREIKVKLLSEKLWNKYPIFPLKLIYYNDQFIGYTMPYIKSLSLYQYAFSPKKELLTILYKAKDEIEKFHAENILLGDINQHNILIDENNTVIICDLDNSCIDSYKTDNFRDFQLEYLVSHEQDINLDYFAFNIVTISMLTKIVETFVMEGMQKRNLFANQIDKESFESMVSYQAPSESPYLIDHLESKIKKRVFSFLRK